MKRITLFLALALATLACSAAPFLVADSYPTTSVQPDSASLTINGGSPQACALVADSSGAVQPKCDLAGITAAGSYTLVLTVSRSYQVTNTTGGGTVTQASASSSGPFVYRLVSGALPAVTAPRLSSN